jgi:hypothetical protein
MIRSLDLQALRGAMPAMLAMPSRNLRARLQQWAAENGVRIG